MATTVAQRQEARKELKGRGVSSPSASQVQSVAEQRRRGLIGTRVPQPPPREEGMKYFAGGTILTPGSSIDFRTGEATIGPGGQISPELQGQLNTQQTATSVNALVAQAQQYLDQSSNVDNPWNSYTAKYNPSTQKIEVYEKPKFAYGPERQDITKEYLVGFSGLTDPLNQQLSQIPGLAEYRPDYTAPTGGTYTGGNGPSDQIADAIIDYLPDDITEEQLAALTDAELAEIMAQAEREIGPTFTRLRQEAEEDYGFNIESLARQEESIKEEAQVSTVRTIDDKTRELARNARNFDELKAETLNSIRRRGLVFSGPRIESESRIATDKSEGLQDIERQAGRSLEDIRRQEEFDLGQTEQERREEEERFKREKERLERERIEEIELRKGELEEEAEERKLGALSNT